MRTLSNERKKTKLDGGGGEYINILLLEMDISHEKKNEKFVEASTLFQFPSIAVTDSIKREVLCHGVFVLKY